MNNVVFENVKLFPDEHLELRKKNFATVKKWMELGLSPDITDLYAEGFSTGVAYDFSEPPMRITDREMQKNMDASLAEVYPDWVWIDPILLQSDDPNLFMVECYGRGTQMKDGVPIGIHKDHYIHRFEMEDGLIKNYLEFNSPLNELLEMGMVIPPEFLPGPPPEAGK